MKQAAAGRALPAWSIIAAVAFVAVAMWSGYRGIGLPPVVIVGGSGLVALILWLWTFRRGPVDPAVILPPFLVTVAFAMFVSLHAAVHIGELFAGAAHDAAHALIRDLPAVYMPALLTVWFALSALRQGSVAASLRFESRQGRAA